VTQQVIQLLGANFNKASFNTAALKYQTKRCGTVQFNWKSNYSKNETVKRKYAADTDVTCILIAIESFLFCY